MDLARKIQRPKWERKSGLRDNEIPADVTADLRTEDNELSLWTRLPGETGLDAVFLALAAGPRMRELDKMDVAWVSDHILKNEAIQLQPSPGETLVADLQGRHVNAIQLDLTRLGAIAEKIAAAIEGQQFHRKTKAEIVELLGEAVRAGRVEVGSLQDRVRAKVEEYLSRGAA